MHLAFNLFRLFSRGFVRIKEPVPYDEEEEKHGSAEQRTIFLRTKYTCRQIHEVVAKNDTISLVLDSRFAKVGWVLAELH